MNYDPNKNYVFTDQNGNTFTSKGDNGYVWQSITEGVPISVDENGEWHVGPYLNVTPDGIVAHVPQWFKGTDEYKDWNDTWVPQLMAEGTTITADRFRQYEKILKSLGSMGGLRYSLKNDIKNFDKNNLLSQDDVNYFTDSFVRAVAEGQGGDDAKLTVWGQDYNSAADFARHYKDLSKEDLSRAMTSMYDIMNKGKEGTWDDKPEYLRDAVLSARILNYIDDNSQQYGKNNEFDGLLKSSVWQQINRGMTQFMSGISSNSFVGIPARLAYAGLEAGFGSGDFNMRIEDLYNKRLSTGADLGANLEGNEAADVVGTWGGTIGTIAVTMATMQSFKGWLNGKMVNASSGSLWGKLGTVADTVAFDFFVNDMPIDLMMFAQDSIKYGADKAWFDPENPQPLFGIPFIRRAADNNYYLSGFGPDVPGGLLMNMVGDLIIDLTPKTIGIVLNYLDNNFNMRTQATVARVREKVAVANLALQEKLANIPVFGEGWHRFINGMMGTRQSTIITEGRKAAIAQSDMDWYIRAQNVLTLNNHNGMTEVYPRYAKIDTDLKIGDSITKFQIDANKYGGMGVTRVEWPEINPKTGKIDTPFNEVPSRLPVQVHQGLLDIERLSELKGEVANEGGLLLNPARQKEIAELEEKISKLPKDIKDFADRFSEANKRVEQMRVELGISTQEWIDSLQIDPRWEKYMTRQALTVGGRYVGTGATPPDAKILNAARKGYYADNYIDPTIALGLKLEALGRAYAWNETQKFVVAAEIAQGSKVIAGKGSVEIAQRLGQVRQELTERVEMRNEIGYDKAIGSYSDDMSSVRNAFTKINDQLHLPERLSLKSVYDASQNPRIKEMVTDFNNGKITFADGVKDNLGLTDSDAASVIQNTYAYKGMEYRKTDRLSGADFDKAVEEFEKTADAKGFDPSFRNSSGEIDAGINGLTEKGRKQLRKKASEIDTRARSEWTEASNKAFEEYKAKHDQWLEGMRKYVDEEWNKLTPKQQEADPFARKIYDEYYKKNPEPEFTEKPEYPKSVETDWVHREMADSLSENLVDKPASLDNKIIAYFDPKDKSVYNENNFNYLTRGEVRRKLINDGYDNLDAKTKKVVDKADNAFIQRTTDNIVLYRAEPIVGSTRKIPEVGDKLDTSAWTYTHLLPQETEIYRLGATTPSIKTLTDIRSYLPGIPSGVIYRFHTPEGTPVFHKKAWQAKGTTGEFVLPRNMDMTVTAISRGGRDSKFTSLHGKMVIVDVEVNPNTGVTPKLNQFVDGKDYAKNVTPDKRMNTEGYKQFKEEHLERVKAEELSPETEDFITHIIRPGGDVDVYNSFLRDGTYKDKSDWAYSYIDDFEDRYADDIEDIAFQFFQSDAEKIAKEFEVDFNEKGYWDTMIKYQGALKDMLSEKILEGLEGNYRLKDDTILYRGVNTEGTKLNPAGDFSWLKEGGEFKDNGFGFVSLSDNAAKHYADGGKGEKVILEYKIPEGQRLFYFGEIGKGGNDGGAFVLPSEITGTVGRITTDESGYKHVEILVGGSRTLVGNAEGGGVEFNVPDTMKDVPEGATIDYNAGMSPDGRAFKYEIEDGKITSMEEITDSEGLSAALTHVGGSFNVPQKFVETMGTPISQAVGRTIMFYRDNMPDIGLSSTFYTTYDYGNWGFVPWPNQSNGMNPFGVKVVDGKVEIDTVPVYICQPLYQKGREKGILADKKDEVTSGRKPKNTATLESTPTHENGHSLVNRLGILELNRKIDEGVAPKIKSLEEAMERIPAEIEGLQEIMIKNALESLGMEYTNSNVNRMAATISEYAMKPIRQMTEPNPRIKNGHGEIFSEAMRMYQGNGQNSSPFCLAIVEQMKKFSENHSMAAAPGAVMAKNGLDIPKKMMKDEQYNFPASVKTNKQKAKWLDEWRQKNPYIKGKKMFTETDYQKANLWDTFFQKEIRSYDAKSKSAMPDVLATKNGDFLKKLSADAAKNMVDEIKKASIKGFDEDLASIVLSGNSRDIFNGIQEFIVKRVNKTASEIAKKMPGGATAENMTKARATVWGEGVMKNETISMLQSLSPDAGSKSVVNFVDKLFKEQAEGFASIDALPLDTKNLIEQKEELQARLAKENRYAQKKGKEVDSESPLKGEHTQIISYKQDGEDVYVVITDPVVATLLQKPDQMKENKLSVEAMAYAANFVSRAYRVGTTSANPIAYVRNVLRDPMQATIQGNFNPLNMTLSPDIFYHTLRDYGLDDKTIKTVTDKLYTWSKSSGLTQEMRNMGIDTPGNVGYRSRTEKVAKKIRNSDNLATKIIEWGERPLEAWETMFRNQIAQQSFAKNYRRTGDVNKALGQAYFDASNSTTNFSHSIACFKRATGTVPYLSSAINGTRSFWVQFNADPIGMVTRISAGFMVPAMAITAWNLSSEERRKAYMNLPEWYRDGHLVLVDLEGNVFSLPLPEELSQFYGTARRLIEFTQEASPYSIPQILAKGAFGFLPVETDGYFGEDGSINWERGTAQMLSGLMPQAVTAIYEFAFEKDLFTGQDLSDYTTFQRWLNAGTNVLGTGFKNLVNDVGTLLGAPKEFRLGKNTAETLARDLFGVGFDNVKYEFMEYIGNPTEYNYETGKTKQATGLFKENEKLQEELAAIDKDIAFADEEKKAELEELKQKKINDFTERVTSLTNKYLTLYSQAGGLEEWQKEKLVKLLTLGRSTSTAAPDSYQKADSTTAYLNERALAQQRYIDAGLPAGPSVEALADGGSIDLQAAINRFYGVTKQATQDYKNAVEDSGMKDVKNRFYAVIQKIYDSAEEQNKQPDYDLIERIQARYLQMMDSALIPIINQYGINILNNNDFIDAVRRQVSGMIPSDDWRQSEKNVKRFLSTKEFPTATVDVKKWLKKRYGSGMRDRGLDSDPEVTERLESIKADIDAGRMGAAAGKIDDLKKGVNKASFYISSKDLQTLNELYNMVK